MSFAFVAGNLALDFVGTVACRDTLALERLPAPADLGQWLVDGQVLTVSPALEETDLAEARILREAIYRAVRDVSAGGVVDAGDRRLINQVAHDPDASPELADDGSIIRRGGGAEACSAIARAAVLALAEPASTQLRWCDGADCTRPFLDTSRAHSRRWCGMSGCGDRAKAASYRQRRRGTPQA